MEEYLRDFLFLGSDGEIDDQAGTNNSYDGESERRAPIRHALPIFCHGRHKVYGRKLISVSLARTDSLCSKWS
jgi:hypothetical protein